MKSLGVYHKGFKAYDIRSLWQDEIDAYFAYLLGCAIGNQYASKHILIGGDTRLPNDELIDHLITGLKKYNCTITVAGMKAGDGYVGTLGQSSRYGYISSSTMYGLVHDYDLGIIVSASHNPASYVGFKVVQHDHVFVATSILREWFDSIYNSVSHPVSYDINTHHIQSVPADQYDQLTSLTDTYFADIAPGLTIAVDYSNGGAIAFEQQYLTDRAQLNGHTLIQMNSGADGTYSNHPSDTLDVINYQQLITAVLGDQADIGIMFDGDADRIGVVTSSGQLVPGDLVLSMIVGQIDASDRNIVFDAMCGNSIRRAITDSGNTPVVCKMGRYFINEHMREVDAILGGEISGHIMFKELGNTENVLVAISYLLKSIQTTGSLDDQLKSLTQGIYREPMLNLHVSDPDMILSDIKSEFAHLNPLEIDGVNIYSDTMCMTVRKSNTEPIIRIQLETSTKEEFHEILNKIKAIIKQ